jgi:hypothetical protein
MIRKSLDYYMNDPDIADEPMGLREVHAIRLMIADEIKDLNFDERREYFSAGAKEFFAKREKTLA